ncbi:HET domain-containing protein [Fusarium sp. LHS14.1]|nr:HET domain-containing protein [Fusarium sp. LHS14.1]
MRLLEIESETLKEFPDETRMSYAILSHRWEDDEVLFQDITQGTAPLKKGWQKVEKFCRIAQKEGFRYVWIDTCCIDKSSSAELSEAINSMYRWYQNADTCFAYLNDCSYEAVHQPGSTKLENSKWFTRGWTLQELIAPTEVVFLSAEWKEFGTKRTLAEKISEITKIDGNLLEFPKLVNKFCAAQKLSWAATRETTRIEDRAYSLMGLFNVNMPLLYGEGNKAFFRLQMEILQSSNDQSIFAWEQRPDPVKGRRFISSILATSLEDFEGCHRIRHTPREIEIDHDSGKAELTQQVVGPFIKLKALSIPYDGPLRSEELRQQPPWLTSVYRNISKNCLYVMQRIWVVFLVDCSEEDTTIGIALHRSGGSFSRYHGPSRIQLPRRLGSRSHADLKERIFHVPSLINDTLIVGEPTTFHLRHFLPQYQLWTTTPVLLPSWICDSQIYWRNDETHQNSLGMTLRSWKEHIATGSEGVYFSLGFRTMCGTDSLPPFHLEFWYTLGDDGGDGDELVVLLGKGALTQNPVASQKPSSPDLLLGPQEFELIRDFVAVVRARKGNGNKILLSISAENEWMGDPSRPSTSAQQGKRGPDA